MIRNYDDPLTMLEHHQIGLSAVERDMARAIRKQERTEADHRTHVTMNPPFTHQVDRMLTEIDRVERAVHRVDRIAIGFLALVGTIGVVSWLLTLGLLRWLMGG